MKTYRQFLKEQQDNTLEKILNKYPQIREDCSDFLRLSIDDPPGKFLYRGVANKPDYYHATNRTKRLTGSSQTELANLFNSFLEKKGIATKRDAATYTFRNIQLAEDYGMPYYIFPCNGFKYCWSKTTNTFYNDLVLSWGLSHFAKFYSPKIEEIKKNYPKPLYSELKEAVQRVPEDLFKNQSNFKKPVPPVPKNSYSINDLPPIKVDKNLKDLMETDNSEIQFLKFLDEFSYLLDVPSYLILDHRNWEALIEKYWYPDFGLWDRSYNYIDTDIREFFRNPLYSGKEFLLSGEYHAVRVSDYDLMRR